MMKGLELLPCEAQLNRKGLFNLEKKNHTRVLLHIQENYEALTDNNLLLKPSTEADDYPEMVTINL